MYRAIKVDTEVFKCYNFEENDHLINLSKINLFIGPNSSGKSQLLRAMFSSNETFSAIPYHYDVAKINNLINNFKQLLTANLLGYNMELSEKFNDLLQPITLINGDSSRLNDLRELRTIVNNSEYFKTRSNVPLNLPIAIQLFTGSVAGFEKDLTSLIDLNSKILDHKSIYIPVLRGLRKISNDNQTHRDFYVDRTKHDYFKDIANIENGIFSGLGLFESVRSLLLGDFKSRGLIKDFEVFLGNTFFSGQTISIIPRENSDLLFIKIGDEEELPIHKLGDGIQSIIILTYPLFINKEEKTIFYYEEPDLYLHAGFQRIFIETLALKEFHRFQYFISTHSNHFLDMTLDFKNISVYSFNKASQYKFEVRRVHYSDLNILKELGVRNSSVFLTNCTIWVEGISDRIYLRKFLELYQNKLVTKDDHTNKLFEDMHYSFVEYAGGNITHWSFLENDDVPTINITKLCGNLFLISDKDGASSKTAGTSAKEKRHEELKKKLGERYYCLECREMENILTETTVEKIIRKREKPDAVLEFKKLKQSNYTDKYLGKFIEDNVVGCKLRYQKSTGTGTIWDKVEFARMAADQIISFDELSKEAQGLTIKVYNFIKEHND